MKQTTWIPLSLFLAVGCTQVTLNVSKEMNVRAGQPVRFDAYTEEAASSKYQWDFGDGTKGEGATPQHTYAEAGDYTAKIKVKGDRKKGKATIKVHVGPPSALSILPKDAGFVVLVDNFQEAKTAWDLLSSLPTIKEEAEDFKNEFVSEFGFFPLDEKELTARGFDPAVGGGMAIVKIEDQYVPVFAAGVSPDGKASTWLKGFLSEQQLVTKDEADGGATITHFYYRNKEEGAFCTTKNFLLYAPSVKTSTDYHVKAIKAALASSSSGGLNNSEWIYHAGVTGGASLYIKGGDFFRDLAEELDGVSSGLRSYADSMKSVAAGLQVKDNSVELDVALWMEEQGMKSYLALAPQVPLLSVSPSLTAKSVFYGLGRVEPVEVGRQTMAALPPELRQEIEQGLMMAQGFIGVNLKEDIGEPLGAANALILNLDGSALADMIAGQSANPFEVVFAYELDDTDRFRATIEKLMAQAKPIMSGGPYILEERKSGEATIYALNFGFMEVAMGIKPGVFLFTVGSGPAAIEKALELVDRSGSGPAATDTTSSGEQKFVIQLSMLRDILVEAQNKMKAQGQAPEDIKELEDIIAPLGSFERLLISTTASKDIIRSKGTLELAK